MKLIGALVQVLSVLLVLSTTSTASPTPGTYFSAPNADSSDGYAETSKRHTRAAASSHLDQNAEFKMELIHINDMHSRFEQTNRLFGVCSPSEAEQGLCIGGFARVSTVIKEAREKARKGKSPPVLVLNAGDNFQGSLYYTLFQSEIVNRFINMLQFDALTIGNHEFDNGPSELGNFLRNVTAPIVAANVDLSECKLLEDIDLRPSVVLEVGGQKIGVIGYLTQETEQFGGPCKVIITDEVTAVKREAKRLSDQGIKIIIALGHSGFTVDKQVALEIPEIDLIVGAHSHTFLYNDRADALRDPSDDPKGMYPTIITQKSGKKVPVVHAYAFTKYIGHLSLAFDADGEMISAAGNPLLLDKNVPEDPVILEELNNWKNELSHYTNKVEGFSPVLLDNAECRFRECKLGNIIADAHVHYIAKSLAPGKSKGSTDAPIALVNSGNIRSSIDTRARNGSPKPVAEYAEEIFTKLYQGHVTLRDIIEAVPYDDHILLVKLKGDVLLEVLEHSVSRYDPTLADNKGEFLQVSGLKVTYNIDKPSGQRVEKVLARCSKCDVPTYYPLQDDAIYSVLVPSYMGTGGDGFVMIPTKGEVTVFDDKYSRKAVQTYFNDISPIHSDDGFRILIKSSAMKREDYTFIFISSRREP